MSEPDRRTERGPGLLSRIAGVVVSPGATFTQVVTTPKPAGVLFIVCIVIGLATALPQFTERGRQQALAMQRQQIERMGTEVTPEMTARMERFAPYLGWSTLASVFVGLPVMSVVFGAIYWALFNILLGGTATFKQVLGIVTHAQVIRGLGALVAAPIIWTQGLQSVTGPFNLGALAPMLDPTSRLAGILSGLDFFTLWQLVVTAIGLGVLYRRRSTGIAIGLIVVYVVLVAGFTSVFSSFSGR